MDERLLVTMDEPATAAELGGKAAALAALGRQGLPVPPWLVLTPAAFEASLDAAQRRLVESGTATAAVARAMEDLQLDPAVAERLHAALAPLGLAGHLLAVRSSAGEEDGTGHSFAGQFESYLAVPADRLAERVAQVWRSGFTPRVLTYRREQGLGEAADLRAAVPAVLVQAFVDAEAAGVAFGADPVSGRRSIAVVSAVPGLGTSLVGGETDADTWRVDRTGRITERHIAAKTMKHVADPHAPSGTRARAIAEADRRQPALAPAQVRAVAALARQTGKLLGTPQDIEWAMRGGELLLLQSRPITSLGHLPDPDGGLRLWDNANIAESYSGITTPLTFSFARRAYAGVYRQFCLLLRVKRATVEAHAPTFANMLGLIRGRVYYNLLSWYRMLSLLPGFAANRRFMEQMMGVRESLPDALLAEFEPVSRGRRWRDRLRLVRVGGALVREHLRLPRSIAAFETRLNTALHAPDPPLAAMRLDALAEAYKRLEQSLITRWDAPLVNDFLAMIFFGLLRALTTRWGGEGGEAWHNHFLCAEGGIVSAEPARRIRAMADRVRGDDALARLLCEADADLALAAVRQHPALHEAFEAYLEKFGDRCLAELKLESQTLIDDPTPLLRSIGYAARRPDEAGGREAERAMRARAEARMDEALRGRPLRRILFRWVLAHARRRVRDRENLRFERTRVFGRVRRIFLEMGRRLAAEGVLETPRAVFDLEVDELIGFVEGTATCTDLAGLARVRRAQFQAFERLPEPAGRFETRGAVPLGNTFEDPRGAPGAGPAHPSETFQGLGVCPGVVRGRVRVVRDPRGIELAPGTIVVAERTDPGWIMLFPAAAGLLVEHGSLLSHSAIVSRELGVPSIVALPGITTSLHDGQHVEMDGALGTVRVIGERAEAADDR